MMEEDRNNMDSTLPTGLDPSEQEEAQQETQEQEKFEEEAKDKARLRQLLHELLQEDEAKELIRGILNECLLREQVDMEPKMSERPETTDREEKRLVQDMKLLEEICQKFTHGSFCLTEKNLEELLKTLQGDREESRKEAARLQSDLEAEKGKAIGLGTALEESKKEAARLQSDLEAEKGKAIGLGTALEESRKKAARLQDDLGAEKGKTIGLGTALEESRKEVARLRDDLEAEKSKSSELWTELDRCKKENVCIQDELSQRFPDGWKTYQKYLALPQEDRDRLASYLYGKDFVSFICSASQLGNLEAVWNKTLECKRGGNFASAETLWQIFLYCVRLVNAARGRELIKVLEPSLGDRYDTEKHSTTGTDSTAQGTVQEVILPGYRNLVKKQIIQKSNVRVG